MSFTPFLVLAVAHTPSPECHTRRCDLRILSRRSPMEGLLACPERRVALWSISEQHYKASFLPEPTSMAGCTRPATPCPPIKRHFKRTSPFGLADVLQRWVQHPFSQAR